MKAKVSWLIFSFVMIVAVGSSWGATESAVYTFFGTNAGFSITNGGASVGSNNSFFGANAGFSTSTGYGNSFFGANAGAANTTGGTNSFFGNYAGGSNKVGGGNNFFGNYAGYLNSAGGNNSFFGDHAGYSNTTGTENTFVGYQAGYNNQTGSNNVFIGRNAGWGETRSNKLIIDNGYNSSPLIYGDFATGELGVAGTLTAANFAGNGSGLTNVSATTCNHTSEIGSIATNYIPRWNGIQMITGTISDNGTTATVNGKLTVSSVASVSDERYKRNIKPLQLSLDKLTQLTGMSYDWKTDEYSGKGFTEGRQIGLIAQEVQKVLPELVVADDKGYLAIAYDKLVPVLIEAVKEQQASIKQKDYRIKKLEEALELIEQRLTSLESQPQRVAHRLQ